MYTCYSGQITFSGSHLLDSPGHKLAQAHETPQIQRGRVQVVPRGGEKGGPLREEFPPYPLLQGGVDAVHQGLGRDDGGRPHQVGIDHRHPRQPVGEGYCSMSHRIYRQVVSYRWDRSRLLKFRYISYVLFITQPCILYLVCVSAPPVHRLHYYS